MTKDYFCIFAGGGVRGTAYIGALRALDELNINISGMAGSSAGAVFASLVAVGYTPSEIKDLLYNINYHKFQDLFIPWGKDFGLCKGDEIYAWLKDKVKDVRFKDLDKELVILATDVSQTKFKEYSKAKTPDIEVAQAVRASISIPGFFRPVWEDECCLVDGDIINNFPHWRQDIIEKNPKIIEFRLENSAKCKEISNIFDYCNALLDTVHNIGTEALHREFGENDQFEIIRINTDKAKIIDFNISNKEKDLLVDNGYNSVKRHFKHELSSKRKKINKIYKSINNDLNRLKKNVSRGKTQEGLITLGNLSIYFFKNRQYIHKFIYQAFLELQQNFQDNLCSIKYLNINHLRNKKDIIKQLDSLVASLQLH